MTDQDRDNEEFAWVRRTYLETPAPAPAAVEAAKRAAREVVSPVLERQPAQLSGLETSTATRNTLSASTPALVSRTRRLPAWRRWQSMAVVVAAAGIIVVFWLKDYSSPSTVVHVSKDVAGPSPMVPPSVAATAGSSTTSASASTGTQDEQSGSSADQQTHPSNATHALPQGLVPSGGGSPGTPQTSSVATLPLVSRVNAVPVDKANPSTTPASGLPPSTVASARPVDSDQSSTQRLITRAVDGLDTASAVLVRHILDSASGQGLPVGALASRVREGVRRGVPGPRIAVVTRNFAAALGAARTTLGSSASSTEIQAGAEAIAAGAPLAALRQIRSARSGGSIAEPLVALADLTTHGVAPLQASTALAALVARDRSDVPVQALRARVVGDILRGTPPNTALADQVRQTTPLDPPRQQVPFRSGGAGLPDSAAPPRPTTP
ncbi:MAG TPA: hypothetical protein VNU46_09935 [Gemmatimonadaceae bacterium]|nr:hypothetical protein [Gemmatimonadaceae bacterium]